MSADNKRRRRHGAQRRRSAPRSPGPPAPVEAQSRHNASGLPGEAPHGALAEIISGHVLSWLHERFGDVEAESSSGRHIGTSYPMAHLETHEAPLDVVAQSTMVGSLRRHFSSSHRECIGQTVARACAVRTWACCQLDVSPTRPSPHNELETTLARCQVFDDGRG